MGIKVFKPISKPKQEVNPTQISKSEFFTGLVTYGNLVIKSNLDVTSTTTLYTVPAGKKSFIIYAFSTARSAGTAGSGGIYVDINTQNILSWDIAATTDWKSQAINFTLPIILREGQSVINIALGAGNRIYSGVWLYEVDASLVPNFL